MPPVSLVVCLYRERDLLCRLLDKASSCYDELVVVHDGPEVISADSLLPIPTLDFAEFQPSDFAGVYRENLHAVSGSTAEAVLSRGGRFYEGPRSFQQEPHWPFAWLVARHDWVLRLDADEYPSSALIDWIRKFRVLPESAAFGSGFTCAWPLWDGKQAITRQWPLGRVFLIRKSGVRFFGMVEQIPLPDKGYESLSLVLNHEPLRKSFGIRNVALRRQAYAWRRVIAKSLLGKPTDLPRWRWSDDMWPDHWEQIRRHPLRTALKRLITWTLRALRDQWRVEKRLFPSAALNGGLHHFLISFLYWRIRSWSFNARSGIRES